MRMSKRIAGLVVVCASIVARGPSAHDPGLSTAAIRTGAEQVQVRLVLAGRDLLVALGETDETDFTESWRRQHADRLAQFAATALVVREGPDALRLDRLKLRAAPDGDAVAEFSFRRGPDASRSGDFRLAVALLEQLPRGHRCYAAASSASRSAHTEALLAAGSAELRWNAGERFERRDGTPPPAAAAAGSVSGFVVYGIEHVVLGYDHVLFLLSLLLVVRRRREALWTITTFTLAHSVTLAVAALDLWRLPSAFVESVIAASVVWTGIDNLARREPGARLGVTAGFGLVHGFGFASVLADAGIADRAVDVVTPLLAFNVGVELGQLAVAAVVLTVIGVVERRNAALRQRLVRGGSVAIVACGSWWLVERVVGG